MKQKVLSLAISIAMILSIVPFLSVGSDAVFDDSTPPTITKVEMPAKTVKAGDSFTITVTASDPSGIKLGGGSTYVAIQREASTQLSERMYYPLESLGSDTYAVTITVPDSWISGNYVLREVWVSDIPGNKAKIFEDYSELPENKINVITSITDSTPPTITKVEMPAKTVKAGDSFTITVTASDPSGIKLGSGSTYVAIQREASTQLSERMYYPLESLGSDTYAVTITVPDSWISGNYVLREVWVSDIPGNKAKIFEDYSELPENKINVISNNTNPSESPKPSETVKPSESPKPSETVKPSESPKPSETVKPSESPKPSETVKPSESPKPSETVKPSESPKPSETIKPSESPKPVDPVIPGDHSDNCPSKPYSDMKNTEGKWFHEGVDYAISNGYMTGVENNLFAPNRAVSRAMVAQILYAAEGKPAVTKSAGFSDVKAGKWYTDAVNWAASKGVVAGYPDGSFKPDKAVTREELATILYKYAQTKTDAFGIAMDALDKFQDKNQIHAYAVNAMEWAVTNKIISGTDQGLEPRGTATRAQLAVMLQAFDKAIEK